MTTAEYSPPEKAIQDNFPSPSPSLPLPHQCHRVPVNQNPSAGFYYGRVHTNFLESLVHS